MQKFSKVLVGIVILAVIVGLGYLLGRVGGPSTTPRTVPATTPQTEHQAVAPRPSNPTPPTHPAVPETHTAPVTPRVASSQPTVAVITNWEERVEEIIGSDTDDTNKVAQLYALFPRVPNDAKVEIAQHLSNLVGDEDYAPLGELLKDPSLPDDALDVLLSDALNRPNAVKLPELLIVAKTPNHPKADEARDILSLFLDEDYGTDWAKWDEKVTAWLKDNPD